MTPEPRAPHVPVIYRPIRKAKEYFIGTNGIALTGRSTNGRGDTFLVNGRLKKLKGSIKDSGYATVNIVVPGRKRHLTLLTHLLVLEAFVGPRPPGMEGCHKDCNRANASLDNLRWDTHAENMADSQRLGRLSSKLSQSRVARITELRSEGKTIERIASELEISTGAVFNVLSGKTWKHIHRKIEKPRSCPKVSESMRQEAIRLRLTGMPIKDIAVVLNTTPNHAGYLCRTTKIKTSPRIGEFRRKLTTDQAKSIRTAIFEGSSYKSLADQYGVSIGNIRAIDQGLTWKQAIP